jgi:hypothetical protein
MTNRSRIGPHPGPARISFRSCDAPLGKGATRSFPVRVRGDVPLDGDDYPFRGGNDTVHRNLLGEFMAGPRIKRINRSFLYRHLPFDQRRRPPWISTKRPVITQQLTALPLIPSTTLIRTHPFPVSTDAWAAGKSSPWPKAANFHPRTTIGIRVPKARFGGNWSLHTPRRHLAS